MVYAALYTVYIYVRPMPYMCMSAITLDIGNQIYPRGELWNLLNRDGTGANYKHAYRYNQMKILKIPFSN